MFAAVNLAGLVIKELDTPAHHPILSLVDELGEAFEGLGSGSLLEAELACLLQEATRS